MGDNLFLYVLSFKKYIVNNGGIASSDIVWVEQITGSNSWR